MITASDLFTAIRTQLDDDNSGRYTEAVDLSQAVNSAVRYLMAVFSAAFEEKRIAPESLRELVHVAILPVTGSGNVKKAKVSDIVGDFWTIFAVEVDPEAEADTFSTTPAPDLFVTSSSQFADRMTLDQWDAESQNPFSAGTLASVPTSFSGAAYLGPAKFYGSADSYILIRPASAFVNSNNVGIWYLANPTEVTSGTDTVEFPRSLFGMIVDKALNYISRQHGPESKLGVVSEKDLVQLVNLMK